MSNAKLPPCPYCHFLAHPNPCFEQILSVLSADLQQAIKDLMEACQRLGYNGDFAEADDYIRRRVALQALVALLGQTVPLPSPEPS